MPTDSNTPNSAEQLYDIPAFGNVSLLHFTDCHAQLLPIYYREPSINLGVGSAEGKVYELGINLEALAFRQLTDPAAWRPGRCLSMRNKYFTPVSRASVAPRTPRLTPRHCSTTGSISIPYAVQWTSAARWKLGRGSGHLPRRAAPMIGIFIGENPNRTT